jgi:hypothetical protein
MLNRSTFLLAWKWGSQCIMMEGSYILKYRRFSKFGLFSSWILFWSLLLLSVSLILNRWGSVALSSQDKAMKSYLLYQEILSCTWKFVEVLTSDIKPWTQKSPGKLQILGFHLIVYLRSSNHQINLNVFQDHMNLTRGKMTCLLYIGESPLENSGSSGPEDKLFSVNIDFTLSFKTYCMHECLAGLFSERLNVCFQLL